MNSVDRYLNEIPEPQKSTLECVRKLLAELLPTGDECISYGLPAFKINGTVVAGFAATKGHCSYYPFSGSTLKTLSQKLLKYKKTKSALHFSHDKPLTKSVIKLLVKTRLAEIKMKTESRTTKTNLKRATGKSIAIKPGGVDHYIATFPKDAQDKLREMRAAIREVAPDAVETVSYFDMPGYSYEGYDYNGMFVWFSFKAPFVRLHVRPEALANHKKELRKFAKTKAIVSFPVVEPLPRSLVKKLVKSSLKAMIHSN